MSGQDFAADVARITSGQGGEGKAALNLKLWGINFPQEFYGGDHVPAGASGQMSSPPHHNGASFSAGGDLTPGG